jgi:hypothetical protein
LRLLAALPGYAVSPIFHSARRSTPGLTFWARLAFALTASAFLLSSVSAQAGSRALPFQGRLTDATGNAVPDGARIVQFKIYDAPVGGRAVWNGEVQNLTINAGLVSTLLGTKASLAGVDFNQDLFLELTVDANGDGEITLADPPLLPRQSILPAVFAQESANARLLGGYDWSALFGTNNPADGILLGSKIGAHTLDSSKLQDNAVTATKIAAGAVSLAKLDATGATAGQSLTYDGSKVAWSSVNAVDAQTLKGFDWSSIFTGGNPQTGDLSAANINSRGDLSVGGTLNAYNLVVETSVSIAGQLIVPEFGGPFSINNRAIYLRGLGDYNHYLVYGNVFGGASGFDGPMLAGYGGGVLGTRSDWTLTWWNNGNVGVRGSVLTGSDRNIKENFSPIDPGQILTKVLALPVDHWNYKADPGVQHLGPVAQDFRAAFGLGSDDKFIATVDEAGVALAAIQGLNQKVEAMLREQAGQIKALQAEIQTLKAAH